MAVGGRFYERLRFTLGWMAIVDIAIACELIVLNYCHYHAENEELSVRGRADGRAENLTVWGSMYRSSFGSEAT